MIDAAILTTLRRARIRARPGHVVHGLSVDAYHVETDALDTPAADRMTRQIGKAVGRRVALEEWEHGIRVMVPAAERIYPRLSALWAACPPAGPRVPVGVAWDNQPLILDLARLPHVGVISITDGGKSVLLRAIVAGLAAGNDPHRLRIVLCDPKGDTWRAPLDRLLHSDHAPATPAAVANGALAGVVAELDRRMRDGYDRARDPRIVVVIDEASDVDHGLLARIVDYGRGLGIMAIVAARRLGTDSIPFPVWSQLGVRFCGRVATGDHYTDRMALERPGLASRLLGAGDFYAAFGGAEPVRFQVAAEPPESTFWTARGWSALTHAGALPRGGEWGRVHGGHALRVDDEGIAARVLAGEIRPTARGIHLATGVGMKVAQRIRDRVTPCNGVSEAPAPAA